MARATLRHSGALLALLGCAAGDTVTGEAPPPSPPAPPRDAGGVDAPPAWDVPPVGPRPDSAVTPPSVDASRMGFCEGAGPPIEVGPAGRMRCAGRLAESTFRFSLCSCTNLALAGFLRTDSYDSARMMDPGMDRGGAVSVNGAYTIIGYSRVGDTLTVAGADPLRLAGAHRTRGDLNMAGALEIAGVFDVERNARVRGNITALGPFRVAGDLTQPAGAAALFGVSVSGARRTAPVEVAPPCPCRPEELVDIAGAVRDAERNNHNATVGFNPRAFSAVVGRVVTELPCGRFFADRVAGIGSIELRVQGRTALFINGDFDLAGFFDVALGPRGELDVFILGSVLGAGYLRMGGNSRPSGVRIYIAGDRGFTLLGASRFVGNIYAPNAPITIAGYMAVHGALFGRSITTGGDLDVHYDRSILRAGEDCGMPPPGGGCTRCGDCPSVQGCVSGRCGPCRTDADCCAPLVCETRTGQCLPIPP